MKDEDSVDEIKALIRNYLTAIITHSMLSNRRWSRKKFEQSDAVQEEKNGDQFEFNLCDVNLNA